MGETPWWHSFFDATYAEFGLAPRNLESVARIVDYLARTLDLSPGSTVFDQCCGIGRLALPLAERGVRVLGVDQAEPYVERARAEAGRRGLPAEFHRADALEFTAPEPCDAAFNWFTSFGYHDDDEINRRMIERAFESLRPGGAYLLDYLSIPMILRRFQWRMFHFADPEDPESLVVLDEPKPDWARGVIDSAWTFIHPDGRRERRHVSTRLYMPHELVALFRRSGFEDVTLYGSLDGGAYDMDSVRCMVRGRRR